MDTHDCYEPQTPDNAEQRYLSDSNTSDYSSPIHELHISSESYSMEYELVANDPHLPYSPESLESSRSDEDDKAVSGTCTPTENSTVSPMSTPANNDAPQHDHNYEACALEQNDGENDKSKTSLTPECLSTPSDCETAAAVVKPTRTCPLPSFSWANADEVWQLMCEKDEANAALRTRNMLEQHPRLQPYMRTVLLDWLIEICEVFELHRATYYLAVDFVDRYIRLLKDVHKSHLQLIGVTCLYVAAKVEEICTPAVSDYEYVTDGACSDSDIVLNELNLLSALGWKTNVVTPIAWLGTYMQVNVSVLNDTLKPTPDSFVYPQFSTLEFVHASCLLDLCSYDIKFADFPYAVLAAAVMTHTFNKETALRCSGFDWESIESCVRWMEPFFVIVVQESKKLMLPEEGKGMPSKKGFGYICPTINIDKPHLIQTRATTIDMLAKVNELQEQQQQQQQQLR